MTPLLGFLPDVDPATAGAMTDCSNVIPYANGMRGAPLPVAVGGIPALAAECRNAAVATKLDGTRRVMAGTSAKLYELSGGAWSDVSRGGSYSLGSDDRWDFVQFGNATLASNKSTTIQRSNGSGAFADIATAPKAKIIESAGGFVLAFDTNDGTYGDSPDRWWCCGINDETTWTPSLTTQATTGRLVSAPGAITAAKAFGDQVMVYKDRAIYLGRYVGTPSVWQFDQIPGDVGCVGVDAVTDIGPAQIFVSRGDIFYFDGTRPVSIAEGSVRQWFYNNASQQYLYKTTLIHDKQANTVWMYYVSAASTTGTLDSALVYHLGRKQWGKASVAIECAMNYVSAGVTIDTMSGTIDGQLDIPFDSQYWLAGGRITTVFTTAHQMSSMTGTTGASSMLLFDAGDDQQVTKLTRMRVGYQAEPTSATCTGFARMARGKSLGSGGSGSYSAGKFDIRQSGRFHRVRVDAVGNWTAAEVDFDLTKAGQR